MLDYTDTVRGIETIAVPIQHYALKLGQQIGAEIHRGDGSVMVPTLKAEIIGVSFPNEHPVMELTIRHGGGIEDYMITESEDIILSEDGAIMYLEA